MTAALTLSDLWVGLEVAARVGGLIVLVFVLVICGAVLVIPWEDKH